MGVEHGSMVVAYKARQCGDGILAIGAPASNDEDKDRAQRHPEADERGDARHALHTEVRSSLRLATDQ